MSVMMPTELSQLPLSWGQLAETYDQRGEAEKAEKVRENAKVARDSLLEAIRQQGHWITTVHASDLLEVLGGHIV